MTSLPAGLVSPWSNHIHLHSVVYDIGSPHSFTCGHPTPTLPPPHCSVRLSLLRRSAHTVFGAKVGIASHAPESARAWEALQLFGFAPYIAKKLVVVRSPALRIADRKLDHLARIRRAVLRDAPQDDADGAGAFAWKRVMVVDDRKDILDELRRVHGCVVAHCPHGGCSPALLDHAISSSSSQALMEAFVTSPRTLKQPRVDPRGNPR